MKTVLDNDSVDESSPNNLAEDNTNLQINDSVNVRNNDLKVPPEIGTMALIQSIRLLKQLLSEILKNQQCSHC